MSPNTTMSTTLPSGKLQVEIFAKSTSIPQIGLGIYFKFVQRQTVQSISTNKDGHETIVRYDSRIINESPINNDLFEIMLDINNQSPRGILKHYKSSSTINNFSMMNYLYQSYDILETYGFLTQESRFEILNTLACYIIEVIKQQFGGPKSNGCMVDITVDLNFVSTSRDDDSLATKKFDDDRCSVCLEDFEDGVEQINEGKNVTSSLLLLPCNHAFHKGCIDNWLDNKGTCPLCRYTMPAVVVHKFKASMLWNMSSYKMALLRGVLKT